MKSVEKEGEGKKSESAMRTVYNFFVSLRLTVLLLVLIAGGSVLGTLIKQGGTEEEYLGFYTETTYTIIQFFGLNDTYHSAWFYVLVLLFAVNLILCTAGRFSRFLQERKRRDLPGPERLAKTQSAFRVGEREKQGAIETIGRAYRLMHKEKRGMIFEKGSIGRYGVFIIHGSILIILIGSLVGHVYGFKGWITLSVGETKDRIMLRGGRNPGELPLGFSIKCREFKASFYPNGSPKEYASTIEVMEKGKLVEGARIRVNEPFVYKGLHFYQSTYGKTASSVFLVDGERVVLGEGDSFRRGNVAFMMKRFAAQVHRFGPGVEVAYIEGGEPRTTWFLRNVERLRSQQIGGVDVRLDTIEEKQYTGLEVARDPGVPIVWAGFALILFGLCITFFVYYRRVYVVEAEDGLIVAGHAAKNKEAFRREFNKLREALHDNTP